MSTDPHLAAYVKGLEDAARECDEVAGENHWAFAPERHELVEVAAARIRALSPLAPGSRVVVVPAEGSPEWEALVAGASCAGPGGPFSKPRTDCARAALRALTGGEKS